MGIWHFSPGQSSHPSGSTYYPPVPPKFYGTVVLLVCVGICGGKGRGAVRTCCVLAGGGSLLEQNVGKKFMIRGIIRNLNLAGNQLTDDHQNSRNWTRWSGEERTVGEPPTYHRMGWHVQMHTPNLAILLLGTYSRQMKNLCPHKDLKVNVHSSIHSSQKSENNPNFHQLVNEQMWYIHITENHSAKIRIMNTY